MIELLRGLGFVLMLFAFYPLPLALVIAGSIRFVFGWTQTRKLVALSAVLALPQAYLVVVESRGLFAATAPAALVIATLFLMLAGVVLWGLAMRRGGSERYWLEPFALLGAAIFLIFSISNWIVR